MKVVHNWDIVVQFLLGHSSLWNTCSPYAYKGGSICFVAHKRVAYYDGLAILLQEMMQSCFNHTLLLLTLFFYVACVGYSFLHVLRRIFQRCSCKNWGFVASHNNFLKIQNWKFTHGYNKSLTTFSYFCWCLWSFKFEFCEVFKNELQGDRVPKWCMEGTCENHFWRRVAL
jgi:hypothetical protein